MTKHRVLIVDDERDTCWLMKTILEEEGLNVDTSYDGPSALNKVSHAHDYDVVVLDYRLPSLSGLAILEKLHALKTPMTIIMISAFGDEVTRAKAKKLGAYAFLDKPFYIDELVRLIKKALKGEKGRCLDEQETTSRHFGISSDGDLEPCGLGRHSVA